MSVLIRDSISGTTLSTVWAWTSLFTNLFYKLCFMLSIVINRVEQLCVIVIIRHNYTLMHNLNEFIKQHQVNVWGSMPRPMLAEPPDLHV